MSTGKYVEVVVRLVTHIPEFRYLSADEKPFARTYCGKVLPAERCIDLRTTCIEEATCKTCQRSDDRRVVENYRRERGEAIAAGKPFPEDQ
jgi:hypothetical protein